jgi:hypothetical protein
LLTGRAIIWVSLGMLWVPTRAALGYLAADAISLAVFVPLGVAACIRPLSRRQRSLDVWRLAVLACLTACAAMAVLPGWTDSVRTLLAAVALLISVGVGLAFVLDEDERAALRALRRPGPRV